MTQFDAKSNINTQQSIRIKELTGGVNTLNQQVINLSGALTSAARLNTELLAIVPTVVGQIYHTAEALPNTGKGGGAWVAIADTTTADNGGTIRRPSAAWVWKKQLQDGAMSVMDFGADGGGVVDDTAAILACETAAALTGLTIAFPAGTYLITGSATWVWAENVALRFMCGAAIKLGGAEIVVINAPIDAPVQQCIFKGLTANLRLGPRVGAVQVPWFGIGASDDALAVDNCWLGMIRCVNASSAYAVTYSLMWSLNLNFPPGVYIHGMTAAGGSMSTWRASGCCFADCDRLTITGKGACVKVRDGTRYDKSLAGAGLWSAFGLVFFSCDDLVVDGLEFDGNAANLTYSFANHYGTDADQGGAVGIILYGCARPKLTNLYIHHAALDNLYICVDDLVGRPYRTGSVTLTTGLVVSKVKLQDAARVNYTLCAVNGASHSQLESTFTPAGAGVPHPFPYQNAIDIEPNDWDGWELAGPGAAAVGQNGDVWGLFFNGWSETTGPLYYTITLPAGCATISIYAEAGHSTLLAHGALADNLGGVATLVEDGSSGLTGIFVFKSGAAASTDATNVITEPFRDIDNVSFVDCKFSNGIGSVVNAVGKAWHTYNVSFDNCTSTAEAESSYAVYCTPKLALFRNCHFYGAISGQMSMSDCVISHRDQYCLPTIINPATGTPYYNTAPEAYRYTVLNYQYGPTLVERCTFSAKGMTRATTCAYIAGHTTSRPYDRPIVRGCTFEHVDSVTTYDRGFTVLGDVLIENPTLVADVPRYIYTSEDVGGYTAKSQQIGAELRADSAEWHWNYTGAGPNEAEPWAKMHGKVKRVAWTDPSALGGTWPVGSMVDNIAAASPGDVDHWIRSGGAWIVGGVVPTP